MLRAQSGDREALNELLKNIQEPLYRYISTVVREQTPAENILHEVFIRIYRKLGWLRELSGPKHNHRLKSVHPWRNVMQWLYLVAAILGAILPLSQLVPFVAAHGFDMNLFFRQLFQNHISAFFGMDVIVSSLVLWLFVFSEGRRRGMKSLWVYVVCNLTVGVSLALPLFLFFRERKRNHGRDARATTSQKDH